MNEDTIPDEFLPEYEKERWKEKKNYERFKKAKDKRKEKRNGHKSNISR